MLLVLLLLLFRYYPVEKILNVYFWNKSKIMFQIDLNSDLNGQPDLKSRCCFTLLEQVMPGSWICLNPNLVNIPRYATLWICMNMRETVHAYISQSSKYVSICSEKIQKIHELLLSSLWNWVNIATVLNMPR